MAIYNYVVVQKDGTKKKGHIEAQSEESAIKLLRDRQLTILSVSEQGALNKDIELDFLSRASAKDLAIFCNQFRSILSAGITVSKALEMLCEEAEKKVMANAIRGLYQDVEKGDTLAEAMQKRGNVFPPIMVNMIMAGESSGSLELALERMAIQFEKDSKLKSAIIGAMVYPCIVCLVAIGVVVLMMTKVIPSFSGMFADMDMELPAVTRAVMGVSNFMVENTLFLILILAGIIAGIIIFKKSDAGKELFGNLGIKAPIFGKLTKKSSSARLARTLSTLLGAGIGMIEAVDITARTMTNHVIQDILFQAKRDISQGDPLSIPLENSEVFPPRVIHMLRIGEDTGNMEAMLDNLAEYYEEEVETATKTMMTILEPLLIIILALIVGVIIMAIMTPMMSIYSNVGNM